MAWSVIGALYAFRFSPDNYNWDLVSIINHMINTEYVAVYWFFKTLFCIYLSIPFWSLFKDKMFVFKYIILITFIMESLLPFVCNVLGIRMPALSPTVATGYLVFAVLGYYLANINISKGKRKVIYLLAIIGFVLHFGGTLLYSSVENGISNVFKGYANVPSFLCAVGVFVFFKYVDYENFRGKKLINNLSKLTFGIYLMHIFVVWQAPALLGFSNFLIIWRTVGAVAVFTFCATVVALLKKIPVINRLLVP